MNKGDEMVSVLKDLEELIREMIQLRKNLHWTQAEFAKRCGKSQSLIAKIEQDWGRYNKRERKRRIQPSYNTIKAMYDTLMSEYYKGSKEKKAREVMNGDIVSVDINDTVEKAARIMKERDFSQLPVIDKDVFVGSVTSNDLLGVPTGTKIKKIMGPAFQIVHTETPVSAIKELMRELDRKAVLVKDDNNKIIGIITPHDLL